MPGNGLLDIGHGRSGFPPLNYGMYRCLSGGEIDLCQVHGMFFDERDQRLVADAAFSQVKFPALDLGFFRRIFQVESKVESRGKISLLHTLGDQAKEPGVLPQMTVQIGQEQAVLRLLILGEDLWSNAFVVNEKSQVRDSCPWGERIDKGFHPLVSERVDHFVLFRRGHDPDVIKLPDPQVTCGG